MIVLALLSANIAAGNSIMIFPSGASIFCAIASKL